MSKSADMGQVRRTTGLVFFFVAAGLLFLGFYRNQFGVVREKKFKEFQLDSESLIMARLVESRQAGLLSQNGLLGWGDANPQDLNQSDYAHQYDVYLSGDNFQSYSLYKSVSGTQGFFFGVMDRLSPFSPAQNLRNFRALEALLLALTLSTFGLWALSEFGILAAAFWILTTIVSQWIVLFGHNLFYFIWTSFLPLTAMVWYLEGEARMQRKSNLALAGAALGCMFLKCMTNGYDFIIPALSMPVLPVVYYAARDRWPPSVVLNRLAVVAASLAGAVLLSLLVLAAQLQVSEGSFVGGAASILSTFDRRTYADPSLFPNYAESLKSNAWSVLWTYVHDDTAVEVLGLSFLGLIGIFAGVSALYLVVDRKLGSGFADRTRVLALIASTWIALFSPISWFLIFKGQAYVHTHTNYLAWHMPFTLFGYLMLAVVLRSIFLGLRSARPHARTAPAGS
jgi:hypothetical protein